MMVLIALVIIIIIIVQNNKLTQENIRLKKELFELKQKNNEESNWKVFKKEDIENTPIKEKIKKFCPHCGFQLNPEKKFKFCPSCGFDLIGGQIENKEKIINNNISEEVIEVQKPKKNEKEIKNNFILITGAILVILSAILFLTTTWDTSNNYLKTIILILMFIVFLTTSKIAEKVLNLPNTARVFYNIALSYIPILLFSISLFGLLGDYLSISGEGKYIYLSLSALLVSTTYYISSTKKNSHFLNIGSYIFEVLTVILTTLIFTSNFNIIIISLLVYNAFISYLLPKIINLYNEKINTRFSTILYISISVILFGLCLTNTIIKELDIVSLILLIVYLFTTKIIIDITCNKKDIYNCIYPIIFEMIIYNILILTISEFLQIEMGLLVGITILTIYQLIKDKCINTSLFIEILLFTPILFLSSLFNNLTNEYIILIVVSTITFITYLFNDKIKDLSSYLLPIFINLFVISIVLRIEITSLTITLISLLLFIAGLTLSKVNKKLSLSFKIISTIFVITSFLINTTFHYGEDLFTIILLLITLTYLIIGISKNKNIYKIIGYIFVNFFILKLFNIINKEDLYVLSIPIAALIITTINMFIKNSKIKEYLIVQYIISFLWIYLFDITIYSLITNIVLSLVFYCFGVEKENKIKYISILSFIPIIYLKENYILSDSNIMYIVSLIVITILSLISYNKKELNDFSILSFIYIVFHIIKFYDDTYMNLIILILSSIIHYLTNKEKVKDLFKCGIYIFSYLLLIKILSDSALKNIVSIKTLLTTLTLLLITRTIISKYNKDYKIFEYIGLALINIISIGLLESELDAMLLIGLFVIEVILSYIMKLGPLLICSLISLLITIFKLTEDFWLNISWWVYVLAVGTILIVFAINNEVKEKRGDTVKQRVKNLKDKFDL